MILDNIQNLKRYKLPATDKILKFILEHDCLRLPNEQINIDGDKLFVRVMEYIPKAVNPKGFEIHKIYADLQYVVDGVELMRIAPADSLSPKGSYDAKGDYQFFKATKAITDLVVRAKEFAFFYPHEAHSPSCLYKNHTKPVKKLVFKIKV